MNQRRMVMMRMEKWMTSLECWMENKGDLLLDRQTGTNSKLKVKARSGNQEDSTSVFANCLQM